MRRKNPDDEFRRLDKVARASGSPDDAMRALSSLLRHGGDPFAWAAAADPALRFSLLWNADVRRETVEDSRDVDAAPLPFVEEVDDRLWRFDGDLLPYVNAPAHARGAMIEFPTPQAWKVPRIAQVGAGPRVWNNPRPLIKNPLLQPFLVRWSRDGYVDTRRESPEIARDLLLVLEAHVALGWPLGKAVRV